MCVPPFPRRVLGYLHVTGTGSDASCPGLDQRSWPVTSGPRAALQGHSPGRTGAGLSLLPHGLGVHVPSAFWTVGCPSLRGSCLHWGPLRRGPGGVARRPLPSSRTLVTRSPPVTGKAPVGGGADAAKGAEANLKPYEASPATERGENKRGRSPRGGVPPPRCRLPPTRPQ